MFSNKSASNSVKVKKDLKLLAYDSVTNTTFSYHSTYVTTVNLNNNLYELCNCLLKAQLKIVSLKPKNKNLIKIQTKQPNV